MTLMVGALGIILLATGIAGQCVPACQNHGACLGTTCSCPPCYYGWRCEHMFRHGCICLNGKCGCYYNGINKIFRCTCPRNYYGLRCEQHGPVTPPPTHNPCYPDPCHPVHSIECIPCPWCSGGFRCKCLPGWQGRLCDIPINRCYPINPCQHGGNCIECASCSGGFHCQCSAGWSGKVCQVPVSTSLSCATAPCLNGGSCTDISGGYVCKCPCFIVGLICEKLPSAAILINKCQSSPCQNDGVCKCIGFQYECICAPYFSGVHCEIYGGVTPYPTLPPTPPPTPPPIITCATQPCEWGGTCTNVGTTGYSCECPCYIVGVNCETLPSASSILINKCASSPCMNQGYCKCIGFQYKCICKAPYTGLHCEHGSIVTNQCLPINPCQNGGTCVQTSTGYRCMCGAIHGGVHCEIGLSLCATNNCENGGTCYINLSGNDECLCPCWVQGIICEHQPTFVPQVSPCQTRPCGNRECFCHGLTYYCK